MFLSYLQHLNFHLIFLYICATTYKEDIYSILSIFKRVLQYLSTIYKSINYQHNIFRLLTSLTPLLWDNSYDIPAIYLKNRLECIFSSTARPCTLGGGIHAFPCQGSHTPLSPFSFILFYYSELNKSTVFLVVVCNFTAEERSSKMWTILGDSRQNMSKIGEIFCNVVDHRLRISSLRLAM